MTSMSLLATFSTPIVSEFASDTGLMRDSSQYYPLWKSIFFIFKREKRDAALFGFLSAVLIFLKYIEYLEQNYI